MANRIFADLEPEEIEEANEFAQKFFDELVGRKLSVIAATSVITLEFITRHTHFSIDDITESVGFIADFNDSRKKVGNITTASPPKGIN